MKYIIEVEDECTEGLYRAKGFKTLVFDDAGLKKLEPVSDALQHGYDEGYQDGLNDCWECARKLMLRSNLSYADIYKIFGNGSEHFVLRTFSPSEAITRIKKYEEAQKKAEAEIKVGDEVIVPNGKRCVVTGFNGGDNKWILCIDENGDCGPNYHEKTDLKKTGRHFPQIEEVLKQMKGE